jgi:2-hydroxycyclohexanecarboxyl-CoA dehydrogenase
MRKSAATSAIVTGGGGAIGGAIARRLAQAGHAVGVFDKDEAAARRVAVSIGATGGFAVPLAVDVVDLVAVVTAVERFEREAGPARVLVNCAGWDKLCPFLDTQPPLWERLIAVNYIGALNMHHVALRAMVARGAGGRVITVSSDAGRVGSSGEAVYAGCKAALIGFSKSIAREVAASGITVNVICPGPTDTPLLASFLDEGDYGKKVHAALQRAIPLRRLGAPEDVAGIVAFLASDEASYITGQVISVSGGLTMHG